MKLSPFRCPDAAACAADHPLQPSLTGLTADEAVLINMGDAVFHILRKHLGMQSKCCSLPSAGLMYKCFWVLFTMTASRALFQLRILVEQMT